MESNQGEIKEGSNWRGYGLGQCEGHQEQVTR